MQVTLRLECFLQGEIISNSHRFVLPFTCSQVKISPVDPDIVTLALQNRLCRGTGAGKSHVPAPAGCQLHLLVQFVHGPFGCCFKINFHFMLFPVVGDDLIVDIVDGAGQQVQVVHQER